MKKELHIITQILQKNTMQHALDIWCGKWYASLLCASYGIKVDAIDNLSQKEFLFPDILYNHPRINFHNIDIVDFTLTKTYDMIIATNCIMFLHKEVFLWKILPSIINSMSPNWFFITSYFIYKQWEQKIWISDYTLNNFSSDEYHIYNYFDTITTENHPPIWKHTHHIQYVIIKKGPA